MSGNDPNSTDVTQEALLEQLKLQHERICRLEARLAEGRQSTPLNPTDGPVTPEDERVSEAVEECEEWPTPPPASLSQWVSYLADALFDRAETTVPSTVSVASETVSASGIGLYEPTLRLDSGRLRRAHRRLAAGQRRTGWRTALTLTTLGAAALMFVQWQQHPGRPFLSASTELQVSIASSQSVASPVPAAPTEVSAPPLAGSPATLIARSTPVVVPALSKPANTPVSRLAHVRLTPRRHGVPETVSALSHRRLVSASSHAFRIASGKPIYSAFAKTSTSVTTKRSAVRLPIATTIPVNTLTPQGHPGSQTRLASFSASHSVPLDAEASSSRSAELSEQNMTGEAPVVAHSRAKAPDVFDRADKTLQKLSDLCERIERHRKKTPQGPIRKSEIVHVAL